MQDIYPYGRLVPVNSIIDGLSWSDEFILKILPAPVPTNIVFSVNGDTLMFDAFDPRLMLISLSDIFPLLMIVRLILFSSFAEYKMFDWLSKSLGFMNLPELSYVILWKPLPPFELKYIGQFFASVFTH